MFRRVPAPSSRKSKTALAFCAGQFFGAPERARCLAYRSRIGAQVLESPRARERARNFRVAAQIKFQDRRVASAPHWRRHSRRIVRSSNGPVAISGRPCFILAVRGSANAPTKADPSFAPLRHGRTGNMERGDGWQVRNFVASVVRQKAARIGSAQSQQVCTRTDATTGVPSREYARLSDRSAPRRASQSVRPASDRLPLANAPLRVGLTRKPKCGRPRFDFVCPSGGDGNQTDGPQARRVRMRRGN